MVITTWPTIVMSFLAAEGFRERWQFRGQVENRTPIYVQESTRPPSRWTNESLLRLESGFRLGGGWQWRGAIDAQASTAGQVTRDFSWFDETERRPSLSVRQLFLRYTRGIVRLEIGKQPLEWGAMDLLSPADRVAPRDLMSPSGSGRLGVWAARLAADTGSQRLEAVYLPRFTPSRIPLADQRWAILPAGASYFQPRYRGRRLPGGPQFGGRYTWIHPRVEAYGVAFDGYQPAPSVLTNYQFFSRRVDYRFIYPRLRLFGGGATVPWRGWLWKTEITRTSPQGLWSGFATAEATRRRWTAGAGWHWTRSEKESAAPYLSGPLGRATWTPRTRHTLSAEAGVQENLKAMVGRFLYIRTIRHGVRAQAGYVWITGARSQYLASFGVNSHVVVQMDWSF